MYINNVFLLESFIECDASGSRGSNAFHELLSRNSSSKTFFKGPQGENLGFMKNKNPKRNQHLFLDYTQILYGKEVTGKIKVSDPEVTNRLISYILECSRVHSTNCAALAQYLLTGNFLECDPENLSLVVSGGLNTYRGQKIKVGDVLGIVYYKNSAGRRSSSDTRNLYRLSASARGREFGKFRWGGDYFSHERVLDFYQGGYRVGLFADFHFLYCLDVVEGKPVFIQQMGFCPPHLGNMNEPRLTITVGAVNVHYEDVPAVVFIKRARRKICA